MSHFTVAVICKDPHDIQYKLAKYDENNQEYFEKIPYATKKDYVKWFRETEPNTASALTDEQIWHRIEIGADIVENDTAYYYTNPYGKFDFCSVGGRWSKSLIVRKNKEAITGSNFYLQNGALNRKERGKYRHVDGARIKDIEWERMNTPTLEQAIKLSKTWDYGVLGLPLKPTDTEKSWDNFISIGMKEYYKTFYKSKRRFIQGMSRFNAYNIYIEPYDEWIDNEECMDMREEIQKIALLPGYQEMWLVIVDCHI